MVSIRDEEIIKGFGQNLRSLRLQAGKTQEVLAEDAGISQVQIARIENGKLNTTLCTIQRLIRALNVDANSLFEGIK